MFEGSAKKKASIVIGVFAAVLILTGLGCKNAGQVTAEPISLQWWGVWDDAAQVQSLINAYKATHPHITIVYRKFRFEEFESKLTAALAEDVGPDIISIHNTWVRRYQSKLLPLPKEPLSVIVGSTEKAGLGSATVYTQATVPVLTPRAVKDQFVPAVYGDAVIDNSIYSLPLSMDSLVLFYNRDLLVRAKITKAPTTWQEVLDAARLVTQQDKEGKITRSAVAMGTANNVPRYFDILSLLMMQTGTEMTDASGTKAAFDLSPAAAAGRKVGAEALEFYTNFANPGKESYTWNASMPDATEAFVSGNLAMMFGYSYTLSTLYARNPSLDIGFVPVPQLNPSYEVNIANYWMQSALKKTKYPNEAWDFIQSIASEVNADLYVKANKRPPALLSLVNKYKDDPDLGVFALSALTATNWYDGRNPAAVEEIFKNMINQVLDGKAVIDDILKSAAQQTNQTF